MKKKSDKNTKIIKFWIAILKNISDISGIMVHVALPDNTEYFFPVDSSKLKQTLHRYEYLLKTQIILKFDCFWSGNDKI